TACSTQREGTPSEGRSWCLWRGPCAFRMFCRPRPLGRHRCGRRRWRRSDGVGYAVVLLRPSCCSACRPFSLLRLPAFQSMSPDEIGAWVEADDLAKLIKQGTFVRRTSSHREPTGVTFGVPAHLMPADRRPASWSSAGVRLDSADGPVACSMVAVVD